MTSQTRIRILEVLAVLSTIGVAIGIAIPRAENQARHDVAAALLADNDTLRQAGYRFHSDSAYFPAEGPPAVIPTSLRQYLPQGFSTRRPYGLLRYRNWRIRPVEEGEDVSNVIGVTMTPADPRVTAAAAAMSPSSAQFTVGHLHTVILFGT